MDKNVEKSCLEEISHFACDEYRKVIITEISNNWNISYKDSESILTKWLSNYNGGKNVLKEYLIRGVDLNGNCVITVVPERKLEALEKICPKYTSSLYSIELEGVSGRRLNITQPAKNKFINLQLESSERKCNVASLPVSPAKLIKNEPPTSKPSTSKGVNSLFVATAIKKERTSNGTSAEVNVKEEKSSPKKINSPKKISPKNESPKNKKTSAKLAAAKSISSFFSAKPSTSKPAGETKEKPVKVVPMVENKIEPIPVKTKVIEVAPPKESKKRVLSQSDDDEIPGTLKAKTKPTKKKFAPPKESNKRVLSQSDDDEIPGTPKAKTKPAKKKIAPPKESKKRVLSQSDDDEIPGTPKAKTKPANKKLKMKNDEAAKNRSRIMQICDSSSDEEEASTSKKAMETEVEDDEAAVKKEKENITPTKNGAPETMEMDADCSDMNGGTQKQMKRGKIKKMVTKTFEDEQGYINSIRVMEEVSCSEDEVEEVPVNKKAATKGNGANKEPVVKEKKKISPPAAKKQGTILSFFSKK